MNHPYLPLTDAHRREMLERIGAQSLEDLLADIPPEIRLSRPLDLPGPRSEMELVADFNALARQNILPEASFLGAGAYAHYIPALVDHLAGRSEFYTAYTPYQPEISQGTLQAIFEYQTFIAALFGLPVANASLYDGPTALAEAILMAAKESRSRRVLIPANLNPRLTAVLHTYTKNYPLELSVVPTDSGLLSPASLEAALQEPAAAVVVQSPNFFGLLEDEPALFQISKAHGAIPICYVHPLSLGLLKPPGQLGAEIVVAEGQPLGLPVAYGGPYLGLIATSERFLRKIPGRLVGETVDRDGRRAFVLTLQTREQHIRREKATSNICSNQALCALRAAIYLCVLGPKGIRDVAQRCYDNAHYLQDQLAHIGFPPLFSGPFFLEFAVKTPRPAAFYLKGLAKRHILAGLDLAPTHSHLAAALLICSTELHTKDQLDRLVQEMRAL
jgi:glycine dehydrogenase subunit 1